MRNCNSDLIIKSKLLDETEKLNFFSILMIGVRVLPLAIHQKPPIESKWRRWEEEKVEDEDEDEEKEEKKTNVKGFMDKIHG